MPSDNDMRLIDANEMSRHLKTLIAEYNSMGDVDSNINATLAQFAVDMLDNAPTVEYTFEEAFQKTVCENRLYCPARPQGEWVRKEDVIQSIAKQYSEHNELVPVWLSIGDITGGAE